MQVLVKGLDRGENMRNALRLTQRLGSQRQEMAVSCVMPLRVVLLIIGGGHSLKLSQKGCKVRK